MRALEPVEAPRPEPASPGKLRILVVEDEPLVRELLGVYLNEEQHEFVTAINGRDGLEKFRQGDFDVVLTDRAMPEMNGDALAAEIKRVKPAQPVILLTGFGDLMTSSGEKPTGVDLVVGKPFTLGTLRNAIAKVVERPPAASS
jgi:DNA-binding response OmpR family regulator